MTNPPFFSFVMAVKNGLEYLPAAIDSILEQSFTDWELVLIDDGSDPQTSTYMQTLSRDPRIRLVTQANIGLTLSLNKGIALARGEYIVRHDGDDISHPERLAKLFRVIQQTHADFIFGRAVSFGRGAEQVVPHAALVYGFHSSILRFGNLFVHGTLCCRRQLLGTNPYNPSHRYAQDFDLFIRLIYSAAVGVYMLEPLYRLRESTQSISVKRAGEQLSCTRTIVREHFGTDSWLVVGEVGARRRALQLIRRVLCLVHSALPNRRLLLA